MNRSEITAGRIASNTGEIDTASLATSMVDQKSRGIQVKTSAAGIIPVIEAGLNDGKLTNERAALMAEFCLWALEHGATGDPVADKLTKQIQQGLERIRARFELANSSTA